MGIVNVTPDSFSDGGSFFGVDDAVAHALRLLDDGADVLDIGGESTPPGAAAVDVDEELRRVLPVIEGLARRGVNNLSIDTRHAVVARAALDAGAAWVNDVSAFDDDGMAGAAAAADAVVLMHWRHGPAGKDGDDVVYGDVVDDVFAFLEARVARVKGAAVVVDPGVGFGKSAVDNLRLLQSGARLRALGPVLIGASRKRFLGALSGRERPGDRDAASVGAACVAAAHGADIVRVHAVKATVDALKIVDATARC
jgi:dihydropteroate synthase